MVKKTINKNGQMYQQAKEPIFALIKDENEKINICLGGYKVSQKTFDEFEQANAYIATKPYELLINVCSVILTKANEKMQEDENKQKKLKTRAKQ